MKNLITSRYRSELDDFTRSTNYSVMQTAMVADEAARWTWTAPNKQSNMKEEEEKKAEVVEMFLLMQANGMDTTLIPSDCSEVKIPCDGDLSDLVVPV